MAVTEKDIAKICELAKLDASCNKKIIEDLSRFLEHFASISKVDLSMTEPMVLPPQCSLNLRDDTPEKAIERDKFLCEVPKKEGEFIIVPKIIGGSK